MDEEVAVATDVLSKLGDLSARGSVAMPFPSESEARGLREKAILRLLRSGIVDDYEVDYGSMKFIIHRNAFDLDACKRTLCDILDCPERVESRVECG
jgi:hypothetical protein